VTEIARAQETMVVDIPFAFTAGNATLPAGEYRSRKMDRNSAVLLIHCWDTRASALVITNAAQAKELQPNRSWSLTVTAIATSISQVWTSGSIAEGNSRYRREKKKCPNWLATRRKPKITLVARLSPPVRDVTPSPNGNLADWKPDPQLRLPFLLSNNCSGPPLRARAFSPLDMQVPRHTLGSFDST